MSQTLSGLFLVGALNRPRKRKRTNRENPRRVPGQIGKIPGKVPKGQERTKKEGQVQIGKPPRLKHPRYVHILCTCLCDIGMCHCSYMKHYGGGTPFMTWRVCTCALCAEVLEHFWGCAKGAAKGSCGETVVQKGVFGESVSSLPP